METFLALIGGGAGVLGIGATIYFAYRSDKRASETLAARDIIEQERALRDQYKSERDLEVQAHAVTTAELAKERDLRASAESERNQAYQRQREQYVEHIKAASIEDAGKLVGDLLALPLPGVRPPLSGSGTTQTDPDALIDPGL